MRIILLTIFGTLFACTFYQTAQDNFFLDAIILLVIALVGIIIFIWTTIRDTKDYKVYRNIICYVPTFIGLLFITANIWLVIYQNSRTDSPTLISGFYDGGFNGFKVDFKTDGSYLMSNGSGLGQNYFYGKYTIKDSIITIDKSNIDNCIETNTLVIRTENYFMTDAIEGKKYKANYIAQIDANGNEINKDFRFRVREDNRYYSNK